MNESIPTDLKSLIVRVAELTAKSNFLEGQCNLLLAFITPDPQSRARFATMSEAFAVDQRQSEATREVARQLLDGGLSQYLPSGHSWKKQPSQKPHAVGSNIIQFPIWPEKKSDPNE